MGYSISGIIIHGLPKIDEQLDSNIPGEKKFERKKSTSLCPRKLTIGFINRSTFILLDNIYYKNISEEANITMLESDLSRVFPNAKIVIIVQNDTTDIYGYSLIEGGKKIRTKCVVQGRLFLDFGELNELETKLYLETVKYLKSKWLVRRKMTKHTKSMSSLESKKFHLVFRDKLYANNNLDNPHSYLGGSLDELTIQQLTTQLTDGANFSNIEESDVVQFDVTKIDFKNDSLRDYIYLAYQILQ